MSYSPDLCVCVCTCASVCIVLRRSARSDLVLARKLRLSGDLRPYSARSRCLRCHTPNRSKVPGTLAELRYKTGNTSVYIN